MFGGQSEPTDDFGILLHTGVLASEGVLQALHELPQRLLVWLPRHDGWWFARRYGKMRRLAQFAGETFVRGGNRYIGKVIEGKDRSSKCVKLVLAVRYMVSSSLPMRKATEQLVRGRFHVRAREVGARYNTTTIFSRYHENCVE
jgi:hypothetical protein